MPRASSTPRSQTTAGRRGSDAPAPTGTFDQAQWRLLIRLPADVMITAIAVQDDGPHRTVPEGLAGLDAIAAGRNSDSDLVRAVVAAIYAEPEEAGDRPAAGPLSPADQRARVLDDCRAAVEALRAGADPADAAAYRHWVQQVAVRVFNASRSGGVLGLGGERPNAAEREFLDQLGAVLS